MQIPSASGAFFKVRNRHDNLARLRKRRKNLLQSPAVGARGRFLRSQFNGKQGGDHRSVDVIRACAAPATVSEWSAHVLRLCLQ